MKDTLLFLVRSLVDHPDEVLVDESTVDTRTIFTVKTHSEDMGKIIGKQGRIIRAIRDLVKLMATKHNAFVDVQLAE